MQIKKVNKRYYKTIKEIFILLLIIIIFISNLSLFYKSKFRPTTRVCLCLIAKNENKYIIEFLDYYKNYGIDKIILYDNNDINGEKFEDIIGIWIIIKIME